MLLNQLLFFPIDSFLLIVSRIGFNGPVILSETKIIIQAPVLVAAYKWLLCFGFFSSVRKSKISKKRLFVFTKPDGDDIVINICRAVYVERG